MSQDFKLKFDEMREGRPSQNSQDSVLYPTYSTPGHVRIICFEWPDGKKKFFNYAYLITGEYNSELSVISLVFTSDTVTISGNNLNSLFLEFLSHLPRLISCNDKRYINLNDTSNIVINEIRIEKNNI